MITRISKKLANYYIKKKTIDESEREVYEYCFDILVSTVLNILAAIIIGVIAMKPIEVVTFLVFFIFLRRYCAGGHAKTHLGCFFALMITIGILILLQYFFSTAIHYVGIGLGVMSVVIILCLAPVDCKNNTIEHSRKRILKIKAILLTLLIIILTAILSLFDVTREYSFPLLYVLLVQSIVLIIGRVQNRKSSRN